MANPVIVVGTYDNRHRAEIDYENIAKNREELWHERIYALALVERTSAGKVKVVNHLEPDSDVGGIAGTVVGGLLGLFYPPIILVTAAAGGGAARAAAHLWHGVSRKDIAELGSALDAGEGGVLVLAARLPDDVTSVLPHATQVVHRTMSHKHADIEALITELGERSDAAAEPESPAGGG
ncbi:MAG TPA: DUF1269 domain-containing protein [Actinomycetes bacterium]|nr:DUF1269 domain-containing protein [Actinomycetes bacterium]